MIKNLFNFFLIFDYKDFIEIVFFSLSIYIFSKWLIKDKQKNLYILFSIMMSCLLFSNLANFKTISIFLINFWPTVIMLFMLAHQNILQKNFITTAKENYKNNNWLELFLRSCMIAMNNKIETIAVIEGSDNINEFIKTDFKMNSLISKEIIQIITESKFFDQNRMIWVSNKGLISSINCSWNFDTIWSDELNKIDEWKQNSLLLTSKVDALVIKINSNQRSFDIIAQGKYLDNLPIANAVRFIDQFINKNKIKKNKQERINEVFHNNPKSEQPSA